MSFRLIISSAFGIMRFFDRQLSLWILFFCLPLLFLPKVNLFKLDSTETAGLRLDDIILFFLGIIVVWSHALSHERLYKIEGWILLLTGFSFFSFFCNRLFVHFGFFDVSAKIFYTVRIMEYFLFFYLGSIAAQYMKGSTIVRLFFLWNLLVMILQKFAITGAISTAGYSSDVSNRVQGIASFPSEMGLILNLLFCYLIYEETTSSRLLNMIQSIPIRLFFKKTKLYWMFCLFGMFIVFTGNRISILALLVSFLLKVKQTTNWRSPLSLFALGLLLAFSVIGIGYLATISAGVSHRSMALFSFKNLELFQIVWEKIDLNNSILDNEVISSENYDMSWWMRIHKWIFAMKSFVNHPECYLQGLGPGFCGAALDGGILRIVTEYGLIGTVLFWNIFASLYRLNQQTKAMLIGFFINMIFFDAYLAYKTMSVLLFSCGHIFQQNHLSSKVKAPLIS